MKYTRLKRLARLISSLPCCNRCLWDESSCEAVLQKYRTHIRSGLDDPHHYWSDIKALISRVFAERHTRVYKKY